MDAGCLRYFELIVAVAVRVQLCALPGVPAQIKDRSRRSGSPRDGAGHRRGGQRRRARSRTPVGQPSSRLAGEVLVIARTWGSKQALPSKKKKFTQHHQELPKNPPSKPLTPVARLPNCAHVTWGFAARGPLEPPAPCARAHLPRHLRGAGAEPGASGEHGRPGQRIRRQGQPPWPRPHGGLRKRPHGARPRAVCDTPTPIPPPLYNNEVPSFWQLP